MVNWAVRYKTAGLSADFTCLVMVAATTNVLHLHHFLHPWLASTPNHQPTAFIETVHLCRQIRITNPPDTTMCFCWPFHEMELEGPPKKETRPYWVHSANGQVSPADSSLYFHPSLFEPCCQHKRRATYVQSHYLLLHPAERNTSRRNVGTLLRRLSSYP